MDFEQYRQIVENAPNLLWRAGLDKKCDYFNHTWLNFTGRSMAQESNDGWAEGVHPEDLEQCISTYFSSFDARRPFEMEYRLRRADGQYRWINDCGTPFNNDDGTFAGFIGSCMDVTERIEGAALKERAHKDGLTGVLNRSHFEELAQQELERARRYHTSLCLVMSDINHFKAVNDTCGHQTGDQVLVAFARFLQTHLRHFDLIARYGGDEFLVLMPNTDEMQAGRAILHLQQELAEYTTDVQGAQYTIRASFGLAAAKEGEKLESVIARADKAMYVNKLLTNR